MNNLLDKWQNFIKEQGQTEDPVSLSDYYSDDFREFKKVAEYAADAFDEGDGKLDLNGYLKVLHEKAHDLFEYVGQGSFRVVYQMDDGRVLKIVRRWPEESARGTQGFFHNEFEANRDFEPQFQDLIPKVEEVDENYAWIVMEKVNICQTDKCRHKALPSMENFDTEMERARYMRNIHNEKNDDYSVLNRVAEFAKEYNLNADELLRKKNMGYDSDGDLKIVDYSFEK